MEGQDGITHSSQPFSFVRYFSRVRADGRRKGQSAKGLERQKTLSCESKDLVCSVSTQAPPKSE